MRTAFLCLLFGLSLRAQASQKIQIKASGSGSSSSSTLGYFYSGDDEDSVWSTDVTLTGTRSKVDAAGVDDEVTRDIQWVNSWDLKYNWYIDFGLGGSNTSVNKIRTINMDVTIGKLHQDFYSFNWDLTLGINSLRQQEARLPSGRRLALMQKKIGVQMGFEPVSWLSVSVFTNKYTYNRDVNQILILFQEQAAVSAYGTAFADELSTLIDQETGLSFGFHCNDQTRLNVTFSQSQDAPTPQVKGTRASAQINYRFSPTWDGSFSLASQRYEATATTPETKYGYVGFGAGYSW